MGRRWRKFALCLWALPLCGVGVAAEAEKTEQQALAESYAQLVFGFCAEVVSQTEKPIPAVVEAVPGMKYRGPFPLSEVERWSAALADRFKVKPDAMIYSALTPATAVGRFHIAYALADRSKCIVLAQQIPDVASEVLARVAADKGFKLEAEGPQKRVYSHAATGQEHSYRLVVPAALKKTGIEEVFIERLDEAGVRPRVEDADSAAWSSAILQTCLRSAQQKVPVTVASFGEFMEERPSETGKGTTIVSPKRYPFAMLFASAAPNTGCRIILSAGLEDSRKVIASWREELAKLGAKPASGKGKEEVFSVARGDDGENKARARLALSEMLSGLYSFTILTD